MTTEIELAVRADPYTVKWSGLSGRADLIASITVTEDGVTCDSVTGGACYTTTPVTAPGVLITTGAPFTVTGHLKESVVTDLPSWVESKGGAAAIEGNKTAVFEIKDGYAGIEDLGFTVTKSNVFTAKDYYAGIT